MFWVGEMFIYKDAMKKRLQVFKCEGHPQQKLQATRTT